MIILEKYIESKTGNIEDCEDSIIVTKDFACVIDGATSTSNQLYGNKTPGQKIVELIEESINNLYASTNFKKTTELINHHIISYYKEKNILNKVLKHTQERMSAAIAIYSKYYNQIWIVGNCIALIKDKIYTNKRLIDDILSNTRALVLNAELEKGATIEQLKNKDTGREYILPLLKHQYLFQNNLSKSYLSHSAIDGFTIDFNTVLQVDVNLDTFVLATDGYPKVFNSLARSEAYLKKVLEDDPLLIGTYKSTKGIGSKNVSFDDRAFLKIEIDK